MSCVPLMFRGGRDVLSYDSVLCMLKRRSIVMSVTESELCRGLTDEEENPELQ